MHNLVYSPVGCPRSLIMLPLFLLYIQCFQNLVLAEKKSYVVYLGSHSHGPDKISLETEGRAKDSHYEFLASFLGSKVKAQDSIFYSYTKYINGFAATLEEEEAKQISQHPSVISVFPNRAHKLLTTRSWEFLGLERHGQVSSGSLWNKAKFGENIIIGNIDTGGAPNARVAAYKVCWPPIHAPGCADSDILAAFDQAIHDRVHVLTVSLSGGNAGYFDDGIAIGAFHAVKNGITVVCAAGNSGPEYGSLSNTAPWIITVGASTIDREIQTDVLVANTNIRIKGQSYSTSKLPGKKYYPLIISTDAKLANASEQNATNCLTNSLDPAKVKGKIVVCKWGWSSAIENGEVVRDAGGVGLVVANGPYSGNFIFVEPNVIPATHITYKDGITLLNYINSTRSPMGYITAPQTTLGVKPSPVMAAFSSRGPNKYNEEILKPDIVAPGVNILAAISEGGNPTGIDIGNKRIPFYFETGTSMACPHIAGIAATVKDNEHLPIRDANLTNATPFDYGSGHVRPNHAMNPGLVYDLSPADYLNFVCALGYNSSQLVMFTKPHLCPDTPIKIENLNYPSIAIPKLLNKAKITRRVKNVGTIGTYTVRVEEPRGVSVRVRPTKLKFNKLGEAKEFKVVLKAQKGFSKGEYVFGALVWSDGKHVVRSPIAVKTVMH
ncbi:Subtilisin-like protease [Rhynchospora pubera]|uniref:Subtilisin-like protease n=1 Tax=Rhynchospora pubera TaxID=906938 RepID=A0AAV8DVV2_9POAL|nr:Subtilisin-like protease [Rhynchospora pubera]